METEMSDLSLLVARILLNSAAISILIFGIFFRNHRRTDLVVVYLACNLGLFSIISVLAFSPVSAGVGFALFAVLSIIRLRSFEYTPVQIAYFFLSLSVALICSIDLPSIVLPGVLVAFLLTAMAIVDHKAFREMTTNLMLTLDQVITDSKLLESHLENVLNARIIRYKVGQINFLQETMTVDVTFKSKNDTN